MQVVDVNFKNYKQVLKTLENVKYTLEDKVIKTSSITYKISPSVLSLVTKNLPTIPDSGITNPYSNSLIFGKNQITNIVSVEPVGNKLLIFTEVDGVVYEQEIENTYWFLTHNKVLEEQVPLLGNQHYKYMAKFDSLEEQRQARQAVKKAGIDKWDIYNPKEASMVYHGITYFKGLNPKDVSILSWDIETTGLTHDKNSMVLLITNTFRKNGKIVRKLFAYDEFKNQKEMIEAWCDWVREMDPSIMLAYNCYGFDWQYLKFVAQKHGTWLNLGRDGSGIVFDKYTSSYRVDGSQEIEYYNAQIFGREIVDQMMVTRSYDIGKKYVSYGLKAVIEQEGLQKKDRTFYDASLIRKNYKDKKEWAKIKSYAIDDADDTLALFDLMIPSRFYFTQSVSKTFQQMVNSSSGSQLNNILTRAYLQDNHSIAKATEVTGFEGALSLGLPGIYKNCVRWDAASLYPSIMRQHQIYHPKKDPKKYFLEMTNYFTLERLKNKKLAKETGLQYFKDLEGSQKVAANSLYGFMNSTGLNYNYPEGASKVTREGRNLLNKMIYWACGKTYEELKNGQNL